MEQPLKEEEYIDEDYEEIAGSENETDLVNTLKTPINILLLGLIGITLIAIIAVLIFM